MIRGRDSVEKWDDLSFHCDLEFPLGQAVCTFIDAIDDETSLFSRGRGRGHATPDVAIARDLLRADANLSVQLVSYGTGAETIRQLGHEVEDLRLPDENPFLETLMRSIAVIKKHEPLLVLAHEEFCIPPAAKIFGVPCVFLTDWFPPDGSIWIESLTHANAVVFMDDPGYYDEPRSLLGRVEYVGPVIRDLSLGTTDREAVRKELGLSVDTSVILIMPGAASVSSETRAPLFDLVIAALELLDRVVFGIWIMPKEEQDELKSRRPIPSNIILMNPHIDIDKTMVAADLVITKGTRMTSFELNALSIPSISISHGLNPVDDYRVPQIKTNRALRARGLTPSSLCSHLKDALNAAGHIGPTDIDATRGRAATVLTILQHLKALS